MNEDTLFREPGVTGLEGIDVRELRAEDLDSVARIDAATTGRTRREYLKRKIAEATRESEVRISLAAEIDGSFAGFVLGRLYYGEFGEPEPVAIVDTIGVDPGRRHQRVATAMFRQLAANLGALRVEKIRTLVEWKQIDLLGFLAAEGFEPSGAICLEKRVVEDPAGR